MQDTFSTIDIQAREWFDKVNGNSYFDCTVTFDYALPTERKFLCPFQYGYGSAYESAAMKVVQKAFPSMPATFWELRDAKVIIRSNKRENCLKRELFNPTVKQTRELARIGGTYYPFFEMKDGKRIVSKIDG
jgi:hypothetical protein